MSSSVHNIVRLFLADLNPPLGYPGGSCHFQDRVRSEVRNQPAVRSIIKKHMEGEKLSPQDENQVYDDMMEEGPIKGTFFRSVKVSSHAQYRMDLRSINVPMLKAALRGFYDLYVKALNTQGPDNYYTRALKGRDVRWVSPTPRLEVFFTVLRFQEPDKKLGKKAEVDIRIDTIFHPGESPLDPVPPGECSDWGGWSGEYEQGFERLFPKVANVSRVVSRYSYLRMAPMPGVQTFVTEKSQEGLPSYVDREKQTVLPPGSATPGSGGRDIPQFSYNGPDSDSDIKPRTLGLPGEQYGHPSNDTYNTVVRRTMTSSRARMFWEDDWEDLDGDPWEVAKDAGINILRGKEFRAGFEVDDKIVAVLFDESDSDGYSFDIAVDSDHRRQGLADKLLNVALDIYYENREAYGEDYTLKLDVVSPIMEKLLRQKGFTEVGREGGHVIMTRVASPISVLARMAKEPDTGA